ncbi:serine protease [Chryseobacterium nematophagum]|uniref:Serine protease n=1 Tax=Chryseobacterium nematophagum TaxID=2305228 RepID=A0A3M7LBG5_9FLAO|nr:NfeD family protein [Chryseobacterium nematophagum]RMZ59385.1 serine protease [Chryseobacterium nematophagum]
MFSFLQDIEPLHQGFWYIALASSLIFLIQTVLTFIGGDYGDDFDVDFDGEVTHETPFQLFSLRNLINFLLGFGWTGVAFYDSMESKGLLIFIACLIGIGFVLIFFFLIIQILKLTEDNTFKLDDLIGAVGEVYLNIPANLKGKGKILISMKGTHHELQAMTESDMDIATGHSVRVIYIHDNTLVVAKI